MPLFPQDKLFLIAGPCVLESDDLNFRVADHLAKVAHIMAASDASCKDAAISYVRGREILIDFNNRKVGVVSVRDSVVGMYLEPKCQAAKADSSKAKAPVKPPALGVYPELVEGHSRTPALARQ